MIKKIALGLVFAASAICSSFAQIASDNAANYGGTWTNGSNGGSGFTPWDLSQNNNAGNNTAPFAGYFLGDSTAGSGNINTGDLSFGIFANPGGTTPAFANANRGFAQGELQAGQTFSLQMAVNFRNGNKGLNLYSGGTQLFNFNIGGDAYSYSIGSGAATNVALAYQPDSVFNLSFTRTTGTMFDISIIRMSNGGGMETFLSQTVDLGASVNNFRLYNSGTDSGVAANNLYFNNLAIVPEPSTYALLAGPAILGAVMYVRRRRA